MFAVENDLLGVKPSISERRNTTMVRERSVHQGQSLDFTRKRELEKRRIKSDSLIERHNDLLSATNLSLVKRKWVDDKKRLYTRVSNKNDRQKSALTAIADMSKIITKYDEAERKYIGTTIELVKKETKTMSTGIAVWNKMPAHRLGCPNDKRRNQDRMGFDFKELNERLKSHMTVNSCELQCRGSENVSMPGQMKSGTARSAGKINRSAKGRSERVTKFLANALEANADILGLGIPYMPVESKMLPVSTHCHSEGDGNTPNSKKGCGEETNFPQKFDHNESKKINVCCIHFNNNEVKTAEESLNSYQKRDACDLCSHQLHEKLYKGLQEFKLPQAPPTTPILKKLSRKQNKLTYQFEQTEGLSSRSRTNTR